MIPEHRLARLLDELQGTQTTQCLYHNTTNPPSLYHDHYCERDDFPLQTLLELHDHTDEVWYIEFSHDGSMLATAGKDNTVIIYDTATWKMKYRLDNQHGTDNVHGVCYVSWSPDDRYILSCSQGKEFMIYDVKVPIFTKEQIRATILQTDPGRQTFARKAHVTDFSHPVTTAAWTPDGQSFIIGSQDSLRPLSLYSFTCDTQGHDFGVGEEHNFHVDEPNAFRVNDISISADGQLLAAITSDNRILMYDLPNRKRTAEWQMEDKLTCVNLSKDGETVLVSMNEGRLLLLDTVTGRVIQRFQGLRQSEFVIRSGFGGAGEGFVVSGSEGES